MQCLQVLTWWNFCFFTLLSKKHKKQGKLHRRIHIESTIKVSFKHLEVLKFPKHSELCNHDYISLPYPINLLSDTIFNCRHTVLGGVCWVFFLHRPFTHWPALGVNQECVQAQRIVFNTLSSFVTKKLWDVQWWNKAAVGRKRTSHMATIVEYWLTQLDSLPLPFSPCALPGITLFHRWSLIVCSSFLGSWQETPGSGLQKCWAFTAATEVSSTCVLNT